MSGQQSAMEGAAVSVAAGCSLVETPVIHRQLNPNGLTVFVWGRGEDGQMGMGDTSDQHEPRYLDSMRGIDIRQVACGSGHTVILSSEGHVYCCGRGDDGRLGLGDNGWRYAPRLIESLSVDHQITQITCGSYHTAAVSNRCELFTWGGGRYGKLGHGNESGSSKPKRVESLAGIPVLQVACGSRHTCITTTAGALYSWGDKEQGVTGHGETNGHQYTPRLVERLATRKVVQISACGFHTAVVTESNELFTWGEGKFGRLGQGSERNCHSPTLVESMVGRTPVQVSCGGFHTAVVTSNGRLYTFGGGEHGQLGHNDRVNRFQPTLVTALNEVFIKQITCGWSHSVALSSEGKVYTCGNIDHGKLGHGKGGVRTAVPHIVAALEPYRVVAVASYNEHTAVLVEPVGADSANVHNIPVKTSYSTQILSLVNDQEFSDVTFIVDNEPVYAHRAILAARSEHFAALLRSGMRESVEGVIHVANIRKSIFIKLLQFLYTDMVDFQVEEAIDLYVTADMYRMDRLRDLCEKSLRRSLCNENACPLLQASAESHCYPLKDICLQYVVANFDFVSKTESVKQMDHNLLLEVLKLR